VKNAHNANNASTSKGSRYNVVVSKPGNPVPVVKGIRGHSVRFVNGLSGENSAVLGYSRRRLCEAC
jgi:hypothetical protein